jgi:hypothetical protein
MLNFAPFCSTSETMIAHIVGLSNRKMRQSGMLGRGGPEKPASWVIGFNSPQQVVFIYLVQFFRVGVGISGIWVYGRRCGEEAK